MKRLNMIQVALKAPKDSQADKYKFRSAEDILERVKPLLEETETAVTLSDEIVLISTRYFLKATATLRGAEGAELASVTAYAELDGHTMQTRDGREIKPMSNEQATGCASSYARKYALCGLFAIDNSEQDPDRDEIQPVEKKAVPQQNANFPKLTEREKDELYQALCDCDNAETREQLQMTWEKYKTAPFNGQLADKVMKIRKQKGW